MLEKAIKRYQNKSIETAQIIEELIELAKRPSKASSHGKEDFKEIWLSPRQTEESNRHCSGTGQIDM
jgi:hypothetical protein